jgi:ABC-2 type transport system permease protein
MSVMTTTGNAAPAAGRPREVPSPSPVPDTFPDGIDLPPYSVWRRIPEWEPRGRWLQDRPQMEWPDTIYSTTKVPWVLRLLLVVGLALGQATMAGDLAAHLIAAGLVLVLFAICMLAVQALPDVLTRYRELGVLKRLRTTPASPGLLLVAQLALIFSVSVVCMLLMVVLPTFFGAPWPENVPAFLVSYVLAAWAMLGLGMVIASLFRNAKVAAGFGTVLFFVLQFFAGLWVPRPTMPGWMRTISNLTPTGAAQQALADAAAGHWASIGYFGVLLVWGAVTSLLAVRIFKWE